MSTPESSDVVQRPHAASDGAAEATADFFYTEAHWRALDELAEALAAGRPSTLLIGPRGSGKTTIARQAMAAAPNTIQAIHVAATGETVYADFETRLIEALGVDAAVQGAGSRSEALRLRLAQLATAGQRVALCVDDADRLGDDTLTALAGLAKLGVLEDGRPYGALLVLAGASALLRRMSEFDDASGDWSEAVAGALRLRLLRRDEASKFVAARLTIGSVGLVDAIDPIMERTGGAPALLDRLLRRLSAELDGGDAQMTAERINAAADALALDPSPEALGLEPSEAMIDLDLEIDVDLDVEVDAAPAASMGDETSAGEDDPSAGSTAPHAAARRHDPVGASHDASDMPPDDDFVDDDALIAELEALGIDPLDAAGERASQEGEGRSKPLAQLRSAAATADDETLAATQAKAPKRRRRRGPRLVDPARRAKRLKLLRNGLGAAVVGGVAALGAVALVDTAFDGASVGDVAASLTQPDGAGADPSIDPAAEAELADLRRSMSQDAATAYEHRRGDVLDVMDGALSIAEGVARRAAVEAPGLIGETAGEVAAAVAGERATLRVGRDLQEIAALPPEHAESARDARIAALYDTVQTRLAAEQYTKPFGRSAYDALLEIERIAPGAARTEAGFQRLLEIYEARARTALEESNFDEYYRLIALTDRIQARQPI